MPFRLLGLVVDPNRVGEICGSVFSPYAASGTAITIVGPVASGSAKPGIRDEARAHGIQDVIELEGDVADSTAVEALAEAIIIRRPHVVVVDRAEAHWQEAAAVAFSSARDRLRFAGGQPAKLYFRVAPPVRPGITTVLGDPARPELFIRAYPEPWVTGVVEHDLFLGLHAAPPQRLGELLAS